MHAARIMRCESEAAARRPRRGAALLALLSLFIAAPGLPGCAGIYRYRFEPMPAVVDVHTARGSQPLLLVSVLGAITPEGSDRRQVHLRYRLQNTTDLPIRLPVGRQRLLSGDLLEFSSAWLVDGVSEVAAGESALADLAFAYPDDATPDMNGLSLGWALEVEGVKLSGTTVFQRVSPDALRNPYPPPGWGPYGAPPWGAYGPYGYGWYGSSYRH